MERDEPAEIIAATTALLEEMLGRNDIAADELVSLIFTATPDLVAEFPACLLYTSPSPRDRS